MAHAPTPPGSSARSLPTTGRLSSRLAPNEQQAIHAAVTRYALPNPLPAWLEVELGIGNGLALLARATHQPHGHFLGAEVYLNGLQVLLRQLARTPCPNLSLTSTDARTVLASLPPASVQRVLVLFPDPWPKKAHHKRRLVQPTLLDAMANVLVPGGEVWVVTDWPDYAYHTLAMLQAHSAFQLAQTDLAAQQCQVKAGARHTTAPLLGPHHLATPPSWWVPTKYQAKAAAQNRQPWFISATRRTPK
jgi:tRNA (guanine-N7-)-methyltransferase